MNSSNISTHNRRKRSPSGFTLAEIVLTVAILGTALLPLLGLIAVASSSSSDAASTSTSALIATDIIGKVQQADQVQVDDWRGNANNGFDAYFDDEGLEVTVQADANFTARATLDNTIALGGAASAAHSTRLTVNISSVPGIGGTTALDDITNTSSPWKRSIRTYRTIVTDLGK